MPADACTTGDRPQKYIGEKAVWDEAERQLAAALNNNGRDWKENPEDGAYSWATGVGGWLRVSLVSLVSFEPVVPTLVVPTWCLLQCGCGRAGRALGC
jgi:hypothetical protein